MPITTDNIRRVSWDLPSPLSTAQWEIRWREYGVTNWVTYPHILTTPEAIFGVNVTGEALSPNLTYIAILELGKDYQVQVRHVCAEDSKSSWSTAVDFDTYLPCPAFSTSPFVGMSPLAPYWVVTDPTDASPYRVLIDWAFNAKGSAVWPKLWLTYKLSSDSTWTTVDYPRDGSNLYLDLPSDGSWDFELHFQCKDVSPLVTVDSGIYTYVIPGSYPAATSLRVRPTNIGGIFYWATPTTGSPAVAAPVIGYRYRIDGGAWVALGLVNSFDYEGIAPGGAATSYTIDIQAQYAGNNYSASVSTTWETAISSDNFNLAAPAGSDWVAVYSNVNKYIDNETLVAGWSAGGFTQVRCTGLDPSTLYAVDENFVGTNNLAEMTSLATYNPDGNYSLPNSQTVWGISGGQLILGIDGMFRLLGNFTSDSSGEIIVTLPGVITWNTRRWANP